MSIAAPGVMFEPAEISASREFRAEVERGERFTFGKNWASFLETLDEERRQRREAFALKTRQQPRSRVSRLLAAQQRRELVGDRDIDGGAKPGRRIPAGTTEVESERVESLRVPGREGHRVVPAHRVAGQGHPRPPERVGDAEEVGREVGRPV